MLLWVTLTLNAVFVLCIAISIPAGLRCRKRIKVLEQAAMFDELTGLYRRRFLEDRARAIESEARRHNREPVFVLFLDVDHFKKVNDAKGHDVGDKVLAEIARLVRQTIRVNDIAARYGGEEILVLGRGNGQILAERLRKAVADTPICNLTVTVSIGVGSFHPSKKEDSVNAARLRADRALFQAKRDGRNRVVVH